MHETPPPHPGEKYLVLTRDGLEELIEDLKELVDQAKFTPNQAWQRLSYEAFRTIAHSPKLTKTDLHTIGQLALDFNRWCGSHPRTGS